MCTSIYIDVKIGELYTSQYTVRCLLVRCLLKNYVLGTTAVFVVYGDSIEVPTCGREKISGRGGLGPPLTKCLSLAEKKLTFWQKRIVKLKSAERQHGQYSPFPPYFVNFSAKFACFQPFMFGFCHICQFFIHLCLFWSHHSANFTQC